MAQQTRKKMGVAQLTLLTMVNMMGSGIIMLPAKLSQFGTISILSWVVTATGATILAYCFAKMGRYSENSGGIGGYAHYTFGQAGAFQANVMYLLALIIANVAIAVTAVGYGLTFFGIDASTLPNGGLIVAALTAAVLWATIAINIGGPRITGRVGAVTIWFVILPVLILGVIGWFWFSPDTWVAAWNPHGKSTFTAVSGSISMTFWAFLGLESASANADAVDNPEKSVPIAVMAGTIGAAILYILSTQVIAGIVPNAELARSSGPFGLAYAQMFNPTVGHIVVAGLVIACLGSLMGWQFTISEVARSMASVGQLPRIFARSNRYGAPIIAMAAIGILQTLLSLTTIDPQLSSQFEVLINLAVIANLIPYLLCLASLPMMQRLSAAPEQQARRVNILALIGTIYSLYAIYTAGATAIVGAAIATFFTWMLYGLTAERIASAAADTAPEQVDIETETPTAAPLPLGPAALTDPDQG